MPRSSGYMRWFFFLAIICWFPAMGQSPLPVSATFSTVVPGDLLAARCIVVFDPSYKDAELQQVQKSFQQIGVDAVAYFPQDLIFAGSEVRSAYAAYLATRQIRYVAVLERVNGNHSITFVPFSQKPNFFDLSKPCWQVRHAALNELLRTVFQDSWNSQKKQNYLVNEFPEMDLRVPVFKGNRFELYAYDLKVDQLAVPQLGDEAKDRILTQYFKENYPLKYKVMDAGAEDAKLRSEGSLYVLSYVHARGFVAREVLGYDMSKAESSYASLTYPGGTLQLKTLPSDRPVYKFFFRHIGNGNVFLGPKWDADENWEDALRNFIQGFKTEAKLP